MRRYRVPYRIGNSFDMVLLQRHFLGQLVGGTVFVAGTFAIAIWLTQSLRFLDMAINGGAPLGMFLQLVLLTLPNFMAIVLPVASFIVVLFVYQRLIADHEAVIMQTAGLSPLRVARPAIALGVIVALTVLALNVYIAPVAQREMKDMRDAMRSEYSAVLVREGVFNTLASGVTVYVRDKTDSGELRHIVIHQETENGRLVTVTARRGVLIQDAAGPRAVVFEGSRLERNPETGTLNRLDFDRYAFDFSVSEPHTGMKWREASERTYWELLAAAEKPRNHAHRDRFLAEAHARLANGLLAFGFPVMAASMLLSPVFSRRGQADRALAIVGLAVLSQGLLLAAGNLARNESGLVPLLYGAAMLPLIISAMAMHRSMRIRGAPRTEEAAAQ